MASAAARTVQIIKTPGVRGGRARVEGLRICVVDVVQAHKAGRTPEQIRSDYADLNLAQIHAALSSSYANLEEIEAELAEDEGWEEEHERRRAEYVARERPA